MHFSLTIQMIKITESNDHTGSKSIFLVTKSATTFLWEPFSYRQKGIYKTTRNLYKNAYGNKVVFEEINHDLELVFTYEWNSSDRYGFIRNSVLKNTSDSVIDVRLLDGIQTFCPMVLKMPCKTAPVIWLMRTKNVNWKPPPGLGYIP